MKALVRLVVLAVVFAASVLPVGAADQTILGKQLVVRTDRVRINGDESGSPNTIVGDPTAAGATLRIYANGGSSTSQIISLPAARWNAGFPDGYGFHATGQAGPVRFVRIRKNHRGRFFLKTLLRSGYGPLTVVPPNPGTDGGLVLTINGGDRYCTTFGGAAGGNETVDNANVWRIINATAEPPCPSPSGAFLDATVDVLE
jgi:hypothetical protein